MAVELIGWVAPSLEAQASTRGCTSCSPSWSSMLHRYEDALRHVDRALAAGLTDVSDPSSSGMPRRTSCAAGCCKRSGGPRKPARSLLEAARRYTWQENWGQAEPLLLARPPSSTLGSRRMRGRLWSNAPSLPRQHHPARSPPSATSTSFTRHCGSGRPDTARRPNADRLPGRICWSRPSTAAWRLRTRSRRPSTWAGSAVPGTRSPARRRSAVLDQPRLVLQGTRQRGHRL